jgi:hypothetical protein
MLNSKIQLPLADAIAAIQRAQLRASSDALAACLQGWSMWVQTLSRSGPWLVSWPSSGPGQGESCNVAPLGRLFAPIVWTAPGRRVRAPSAGGSPGKARVAGPAPSPGVGRSLDGLDASFARYRSSGGHALAQVIVRPAEEVTVETAWAWAWLTPLDAMFGLWRAALRISFAPHCADAPARR